MSFRATLNLEGKDYDVLKCKYSIKREVDSKGRPSSNLHGGRITLEIESTDDISVIEKMAMQFKPISGVVAFKKDDEDAKMKELSFKNAYIIDLNEGINIVGDIPMSITFVVSAQEIAMGDATFTQNWPEMG
jgi:hypothetical protein